MGRPKRQRGETVRAGAGDMQLMLRLLVISLIVRRGEAFNLLTVRALTRSSTAGVARQQQQCDTVGRSVLASSTSARQRWPIAAHLFGGGLGGQGQKHIGALHMSSAGGEGGGGRRGGGGGGKMVNDYEYEFEDEEDYDVEKEADADDPELLLTFEAPEEEEEDEEEDGQLEYDFEDDDEEGEREGGSGMMMGDGVESGGAEGEEGDDDEEFEWIEDEDYLKDDDDDDEIPDFLKALPGTYIDPRIIAATPLIDPTAVKEGFRTGFVSIIGSPNVGKSTLMNSLVGDRLSIVTPKAQTTRHRIMGIVTSDEYQIVYSDTPGVILPQYKLQEGMMRFVLDAIGECDQLLFLTDIFEQDFPDPTVLDKIKLSGKPLVVGINKVDLLPNDENPKGFLSPSKLEEVGSLADIIAKWEDLFPLASVVPVSALEGFNTGVMLDLLAKDLPEGPPMYANDVMSDKPERFFASEIIREQIFLLFSQEIPYSCEVRLERFKDMGKRKAIDAIVFVSRESQKGMLIGKGGAKIKQLGIEARIGLEEFFQCRVNLSLQVKVDKEWRRKTESLKEYGYIRDD